jgi:WD40 repeat protein
MLRLVLQLAKPLKGHNSNVRSVAYSPDGRHIISGSSDKSIRIWDAETGAVVNNPIKGHTDEVWSVAYSPDGRRIISGSDDRTIRIWDAETGAAVGKPLEGHTASSSLLLTLPMGSTSSLHLLIAPSEFGMLRLVMQSETL